MSEVIELLLNESIQEVMRTRILSAELAPDPRQASPPISRRVREAWSSSLCDADLQCLLQVIETELIPRLISGYSPARCLPQELAP
jgi:hypothetical protein